MIVRRGIQSFQRTCKGCGGNLNEARCVWGIMIDSIYLIVRFASLNCFDIPSCCAILHALLYKERERLID